MKRTVERPSRTWWLFLAHRGSIKASKARISMRHPVRRGSYFQVGVQARLPSTWDVVRNTVAQASGACPCADDALSHPLRRLLPLPVFTHSRIKVPALRDFLRTAYRQCVPRTTSATAAATDILVRNTISGYRHGWLMNIDKSSVHLRKN